MIHKTQADLNKEIQHLKEQVRIGNNVAREYKKLAQSMEFIYFLTEEDPNTMTCDVCKSVNAVAIKHMDL